MDFQHFLQNLILFVGLPIAALAALFSFRAGKLGALGGLVIAVTLSLAIAFTPAGTWKTVGATIGRGVSHAVQAWG